MIEGVDMPVSTEDCGADRAQRRELCSRNSWCIGDAWHEGGCITVDRKAQPPSDFGPRRKR